MKIAAYVLVIGSFVVVVGMTAGCRCHGDSKHDTGAMAREKDMAGMTRQRLCPVMDAKVDRSSYVDHNGERVYFCCPKCVDTFKASPDKYLAKLEEQLAAPEGAGQKHQPASAGHGAGMHKDAH